MASEPTPLAEIEARQRRLNIKSTMQFAIALVVVLVIAGLEIQTRQALCTFTGNLGRTVDQTDHYLNDRDKHGRLVHPGPILGVPRATMLQNLKNQKRAHNSLKGLHC